MPVGFILATADSRNPSTYLGGTWVAIQDRTIVGVGTHALDWLGGNDTHTLTEAQLPKITKSFHLRQTQGYTSAWNNSGVTVTQTTNASSYAALSSSSGNVTTVTMAFGSGNAHNNMQQSVAKYLWQRTA